MGLVTCKIDRFPHDEEEGHWCDRCKKPKPVGVPEVSMRQWFEDEWRIVTMLAITLALGISIGRRTVAETVVRTVTERVEVTPREREYCDSRYCIYATPDGLRITNYTDKAAHCETMESGRGGVSPGSSWWAIGRPGPFLKCHPKDN